MSQNGPGSLRKFLSKKALEEKVEEEILSMVEEGHEQGVIEENEVEMISNIFEFSDKDAKDIMTSRPKMIAMEHTMTVAEALTFALENNFSRYPVFEEDIDTIIGVVHLKDLVAVYMKSPETSVRDVMEDPIFIHPTFNISKLLQKMQHEKIHMAIVIDEYGQTEGLVAMEDIIEEIVGNILDEHDEDTERVVDTLSNGDMMVQGTASLEELEELLDIEFPDEDFETLNGFLLYELGGFPSGDEAIEIIYQGYRFTPVKICDKMITLVKIERTMQDEEEE
ncbi:MAG: hemolysin family protein [Lachnospiraceae bacterium]|nr:hemolysin family protein [Lachnospiraceae bacterium]